MKNTYFLRHGWAAGLLVGLWLLAATTRAQAPAWTLATGYGVAATGTNAVTNALATDASGNVFVTGSFTGQATFGSTTLTSLGDTDVFLAKYVPATNTWAWAVRGGGTGGDGGWGLAVRGSSVYVTGILVGSTAITNSVAFESGGAGTGTVLVPVAGTSSGPTSDLFLVKYTDNGPSATLGWTQVGGGLDVDYGLAVAVNGTAVYVTGVITNTLSNSYQVVFGGAGTTPGTAPQAGASLLTSRDMVVAKYTDNGPSATLGWTQVAGGTDADAGQGIAVSGTSVYVTGVLVNDRTNRYAVLFGGSGTTAGTSPQYGAGALGSADLFLAKYTDNGTNAALGWTQVAGGTDADVGYGLAASGTSVYVAGGITNDRANTNLVTFGGTGTAAGTSSQLGATATSSGDLLVAKYTDNGTSAALTWTQVGGGTGLDVGYGLVRNGGSLYVAGLLFNNAANSAGVLFGGAGQALGTAAQPGATATASYDVAVAKYTDNGPSATLNWTQVAGGTDTDFGTSLAVAGTSLYVAGKAVPAATFGSLSIAAPVGRATSFVAGFANVALAATPAAAAASPRLYPNPAPGPATLSGATAGAPVGIFDALGRCVATATADAQGTAVLPAGLAPGLYLVRAGAGTVRWVVE